MPSSARCTGSCAERPAAAKRVGSRCDDHPNEVGTICHGTAVTGIAEDDSVPEGQPKSALAPIRRPPSRAEGHCTGARQSAFFSYTGRGAFSFWARPKREWGAHPPVETAPLREQPPWPLFSGRKRKRTAFRRSKRPLMPGDGPSDTHPSAAASPHGCRSGWTRCPHGPASPGWTAGPRRFPAGGRQRSGAGCGA